MSSKVNMLNASGQTKFSKAPLAGLEFSKMLSKPKRYVPYNAGDLVPIFCMEILPHSNFGMSVDVVNRLLSAVKVPTMDKMQMDIYAYFVPNRIVNESWKNVQGENTSGYWTAPEVTLAPLYNDNDAEVQIPVRSLADYYGFPSQLPIKAEYLKECHDLKARGFCEIYNNYWRDQNYQPCLNYSKLNIYNGFLSPVGSKVSPLITTSAPYEYETPIKTGTDGTFVQGAINKAVFGEGYATSDDINAQLNMEQVISARTTNFSFLGKPIKANKLHDFVTSGLPSPQKGPQVYFGVADTAPVITDNEVHSLSLEPILNSSYDDFNGQTLVQYQGNLRTTSSKSIEDTGIPINRTNFVADLADKTGVSVNDLRLAVATQQIYETLARGGSRYLSTLRSFFGIEAENPFSDIPLELGHLRLDLDMYQVAQTSASQDGSTAQGSLAGFGYTDKGGFFV